jgi:hypothetical protein
VGQFAASGWVGGLLVLPLLYFRARSIFGSLRLQLAARLPLQYGAVWRVELAASSVRGGDVLLGCDRVPRLAEILD